ncbi:hypothetical protein L5F09_10055 [Aliarcobacter butzleri]|nr:hypothetical protein [Aliarcobacter butzleri]MCG3666097.1 hypothetical protein [Aliarcobacter butzleri]
MSIKIKGDGVFKIRNNVIYVHGSLNGVFYRKSTGKKITPATKQWIKKANPLSVLTELLDKEKNVITQMTLNSLEIWSYNLQVLEENKQVRMSWRDYLKIEFSRLSKDLDLKILNLLIL